MKVLLLDGTKKTNKSIVPLYLSQRYSTKTVGAISPDLDVLCQKYDSWENIPEKELVATMEQTIAHVEHVIKSFSPDVIVGLDYGGCVLSNLVTDFYCSGNSLYLDPQGYFYASRKDYAPDDITPSRSYWILSKEDMNSIKRSGEKLDHYKLGTAVLIADKRGEDSAMSEGILELLINNCTPIQ